MEVSMIEEGKQSQQQQEQHLVLTVPSRSKQMTQLKQWISVIPIYSLTMVAIYIGMYLQYCYHQDIDQQPSILDLTFQSDDRSPSKIYRLYTYSLLHSNNSHLINNCIAQLFFGGLLEYHSSSWRVTIVHTSSIVFGALVVTMHNQIYHIHDSYLLGVSGGVYGLLSSLVTTLILNYHELNPYLRMYYLIVVGLWLISDILCYVYYYDDHLSYAAHLGGAASGFLSSFLCYQNIKQQRGEPILIFIATLLNVLLFIFGFVVLYY